MWSGSPRSKCRQVSFFLRPTSLACWWLPSCCVLTWLFLCAPHWYLFFHTTSQIDWGIPSQPPHPQFLKILISKVHSKGLGARASPYKFGENTIHPQIGVPLLINFKNTKSSVASCLLVKALYQ